MKRTQLNRIEMLLERLDAAIVVRDLGTARSAEAFEGLRKSILIAAKSRRNHISHLVALDESIRSGGSLDLIKARVAEYLNELGIERLSDPEHLECFDVQGDLVGDIEILEPAIIERSEDGKITIFRVGRAQRTHRNSTVDVDAEEVSPKTDPRIEHRKGSKKFSNRQLLLLGVAFLALVLTVFARSCGSDEENLDTVVTSTSISPTTTSSLSISTTSTTTIPK